VSAVDRLLLVDGHHLFHRTYHALPRSIQQEHGGWGGEGESSHNNRFWIAEVNRLAPRLGMTLVAGRNKPTRVPVEGALKPNGKTLTTVKRVCTGDVPFKAAAGFPRQCRYYLAFPDWWQARHLRGERLEYPDASVPRFYREPLHFLDEVQRTAERYSP
jgi:hypothetical protein